MATKSRRTNQIIAVVLLIALFAAACGGADTSTDTESDSVSRAAGTQGELNLSSVVTELSSGFGTLGRAERQSIVGVAEGNETCTDAAVERAEPDVSQVEVEIIAVVDDCLRFSYDVANFRSLIEDLRALRAGAGVIAVSPMLLEYRLDQLDPAWPIEAVNATNVVSLPDSPTGAGIVVAVIDSGIDTSHPNLQDVSIVRVPESGEGDYTKTGHGTVAASIITAPIGPSVRGIAPAVQLLDVPADLCAPSQCGCDPCAPMTPAEAIRWSVDNGAQVISMSFGFLPAPKPAWWQLLLDGGEADSAVDTIEIALAYAGAKGVAMAAAAGNCATGPSARCEAEDQFEIPAGHLGVIGVAALAADETGAPTWAAYSTRQDYVELAAPGNLSIIGTDGTVIQKSGTSYATPFVSAAIAVLIGADGPLAEHGDSTIVARDILVSTAADLAPDGRDTSSGHGRVQLQAALEAATAYAQTNPAPTPTG